MFNKKKEYVSFLWNRHWSPNSKDKIPKGHTKHRRVSETQGPHYQESVYVSSLVFPSSSSKLYARLYQTVYGFPIISYCVIELWLSTYTASSAWNVCISFPAWIFYYFKTQLKHQVHQKSKLLLPEYSHFLSIPYIYLCSSCFIIFEMLCLPSYLQL